MTVQALPGNVRFRAFQLGLQVAWGTPVNATRRVPWRFNPTVDPHWTFPDVDTGTLDPAIAPYRMALDVTGQATGPLAADDAQILWSLLLKGGITPTGAVAKSWAIQPTATAADAYDVVSGEWGDEVTGDQFRYYDGIIDQLQLTFPQDLGPIQVQADFRFGSVTYPHTRQDLDVDTSPVWLYGADTRLYIDDVAGSIGITPIVDTMHDASMTIQSNTDVKRFSNGSNSNFNVAGYGRGPRTLETTFNFAKSAAALQEFADWLNANPVERFVVLDTTSREFVTGSTPYQQKIKFAGYWFTRSENAVGSNTTAQLVCRHVNDPDLPSPIDVLVVNGMSTLLAPPA